MELLFQRLLYVHRRFGFSRNILITENFLLHLAFFDPRHFTLDHRHVILDPRLHPGGGEGTQGKSGYSYAAEAFKPRPCLRQKIAHFVTLFKTGNTSF